MTITAAWRVQLGAGMKPVEESEQTDVIEDGGIENALADADIVIGLADVDPVPLSPMLEAIDPDATERAHTTGQDQRERLPIRGRDFV